MAFLRAVQSGTNRATVLFSGRKEPSGPPALPPPLTELRLVPVAAAAWGTAAIMVRLPVSAAFPAASALAVLLLVLIVVTATGTAGGRTGAIRRRAAAPRVLAACLAPLAAIVLVSAATATALVQRTSGPVQEAIAEEAAISGEFRAAGDARAGTPDRFTGRPRFLVEARLLTFTRDGRRSTAQTPVLVIGTARFERIRLGDTFSTSGALSATDGGNRAAAVLRANRSPEITPAAGLYAVATGLRLNFAEHAALLGRNDAAGLLPGMVLGDRAALPDGLADAMKDTGLTHLTAVSGANCSYLLAFVFLLARSMRLPRPWAAAAGLAVLAAFVLVVRPDASVLRAAVMGSIGITAVLTGRGKVPASLLCLCATVLLVIDPWLSGSYAFILSVCATGGLIVLGPRLTAALERVVPRMLAVLTAVPLAAQAACAPVLVLLQPEVPMYSLPANIAAAPVVPAVTIVGMAAVLLASVLPVVAFLPLWVAGLGAGWVAAVARFLADAPGALLPWPSGAAGAALMAAVSGILVCAVLVPGRAGGWSGDRSSNRRVNRARNRARDRTRDRNRDGLRVMIRTGDGRGPGHPGHGSRRGDAGFRPKGRICKSHWLAAAAALCLAAVVTLWWRPGQTAAASDWIAAACDVGQGDALVVRTGGASAVVVDTGPEPRALDVCLDRLRIETVDLLVITHVHADHYGGGAAAGDGRKVLALAYSSAEAGLPEEIAELSARYGLTAQRLVRGMDGTAGSVQWRVLWPPAGGTAAAGPNGESEAENDASAVLLLQAAGLDLLLTGDLEQDAAARLLQSTPSLREARIDVLKVAHHGAFNGGAALPAAVRPRLALISVGKDNTYGHPSDATLKNLASVDTLVARTDQLGTFTLRLDGTRLVVQRLPG